MEAIGFYGPVDLSRVRPVSDVISGYTYFSDGDIVFAKVTPCFENGKGAVLQGLTNGCGFGTTELTVVRPNDPQDATYLKYVLNEASFVGYGSGEMLGAGGLKRVPDEYVLSYNTPWPAKSYRIAIAAFLDNETGKIDSLIAEQESLIVLLGEKRQAIMSHAVTNDSENARLTPAKMAAKFVNGHAFKPEDWGDTGIPIVRIAQLQGAEFDNSFDGDCPLRCHINDGDLLFSWSATLDSFIWDRGPAYLNQHIFKVSPYEGVDLRFLYYSLKHHAPLWGDIDAHGSTMKHIKRESLSNGIWLPSLEEQQQIAKDLDRQMKAMDGLQRVADRTIKLLKERRSALISAAVTGKIDVRNHPAAVAALNVNKD